MSLTIARRVLACTALLLTTVAYAQERVPRPDAQSHERAGRGDAGRHARSAPPSDTIVLFDGKDLSQWVSQSAAGGSGAVGRR